MSEQGASETQTTPEGGPSPRPPLWARYKATVLVLLAIGVFSFAYWRVLDWFRQETAHRSLSFTPGSAEGPDHVLVKVSISHVEPGREMLALRMKLLPRGKYTSGRSAPNRHLRLRLNGYRGPEEHHFKARKRMGSVEAAVQLHEGDIADYPVDRYKANLALEMDEGASTVQPDGTRIFTPMVPIRVAFEGGMHGMRLESRLSKRSKDGRVILRLDLERSNGAVFFAFIVMGIMAVLTVMVVIVILHIIATGRRPEVNLFGWMGGMLFAFPAIRNALPGSPPIGSFIDYLVFFWAEGFVAIALVLTVTTWLMRPPAK